MGMSRRAIIEQAAIWLAAIDVSVEGPDRDGTRRALAAAINATGLWQANLAYAARLWVLPRGSFGDEPAGRIAPADALCGTLAAGVDDARTIRAINWVFGPWLASTAYRMHLSVNEWNRPRTLILERMRTPMLAPWLDGARPVRDLDAFRGFHLGLSPEERFAARLVAYWARYGSGIPVLQAGPGGWFASAASSLAAGGWIAPDPRGVWVPGPILRRMAIGQGELLEA